MPTLNWIGKEAVIKHHKEVPYRLLEPVEELSCGEPENGNLLVQGDNLHALKALLPRYAGMVKCIYIDPPYNTGVDDRDETGKRTGWVYNDNVNSPEIRKWLGEVVGKEEETLDRHDRWLCMMYPRLVLLREFLRDDGVVFISIDENECAALRILLDEIFGYSNYVGTIVWKNTTDNNPTKIVTEHEYVMCYARNLQELPKEWKSTNILVKDLLMTVGDKLIKDYPDNIERQKEYTKWLREHKSQIWPFQDYKFIDSDGIYTGMRSVHNPGKEGYRYDVIHPKTNKPCKEPLMGYRFPETTMQDHLDNDRILFGKDETKLVELKVYAKDYRLKLSSLFELDGRKGTNEIKEIFPENKRPFDFPKPTDLIEELISFTTSGQDIVLDSFAGSGTTGHAVMKLNKADGQNRQVLLIEMKQSIAENITQKRMKRVINGYPVSKSKGSFKEGLGASFQYCRLSEAPLFTPQGQIREDVTFSQLAEFVWFSETGTGYTGEADSPLLGEFDGRAIYLLYNGILKDRSVQGGNVLTQPIYNILPEFKGLKTIYGAACRGDQWLKREQITFKQTPYALDV